VRRGAVRALPPLLTLGQGALHDRHQALQPALQYVVGGACLETLDGDLLADGAGNEDERKVEILCPQQAQRGQPVEGGEGVVGEDEVIARGFYAIQELLTCLYTSPAAFVARRLQHPDFQFGIGRVVLDNEQAQ